MWQSMSENVDRETPRVYWVNDEHDEGVAVSWSRGGLSLQLSRGEALELAGLLQDALAAPAPAHLVPVD